MQNTQGEIYPGNFTLSNFTQGNLFMGKITKIWFYNGYNVNMLIKYFVLLNLSAALEIYAILSQFLFCRDLRTFGVKFVSHKNLLM